MATYGKRKKGLLSSFNVFQDDKPEKDTKQQRSSEYILNLEMYQSNTSSLVSLRTSRKGKVEDAEVTEPGAR